MEIRGIVVTTMRPFTGIHSGVDQMFVICLLSLLGVMCQLAEGRHHDLSNTQSFKSGPKHIASVEAAAVSVFFLAN
uniref:Uncharacterized protein n=1 Tax=Phlebotomus papatasi TaxID=29031 RepID=A0A1B0D9P7_PHLPP